MSHKLCKIQTDLLHMSVTQIHYPTWNHVEHCWWEMQGKSLAFHWVTSSFEDTILQKKVVVFLHALIFVVFNFLLGLFLAHFSSRFSSSSVMALAKSCMLASAQPSLLLAYRSSHSRWGLFRSYSGLCHFVKLLSGMWTWSKPRLSGICRMVPKTWMPVSKKKTSWFCSHGDRDSFGHAGTVPAAPQFPVHGNAWGWGWQGSQQHEWHTAIRTSISRCFMPSQPVQLYQGIRHLRSPVKLS